MCGFGKYNSSVIIQVDNLNNEHTMSITLNILYFFFEIVFIMFGT